MKIPTLSLKLEYSSDPWKIKKISKKKKIELDDIETSDEYKSIGLNIMKKYPKQLWNNEIFSMKEQSITQSLASDLFENKKRETVEKMKSNLDKLIIENDIYFYKINEDKITITIVSGNGLFYFYTINVSDLSKETLDEQIKNLERFSRLKKLLE